MIREIFEQNLEKDGLVLQHVDSTVENEYSFVHIFAPYDTLAKYAEVMKLRMPMCTMVSRLDLPIEDGDYDNVQDAKIETIEKQTTITDSKKSRKYTTEFTRDKLYLFDIPVSDREEFFASQRSEIIDYILRRTQFKNDQRVSSIGIRKLLADAVYESAYPLHDDGSDCKFIFVYF